MSYFSVATITNDNELSGLIGQKFINYGGGNSELSFTGLKSKHRKELRATLLLGTQEDLE